MAPLGALSLAWVLANASLREQRVADYRLNSPNSVNMSRR